MIRTIRDGLFKLGEEVDIMTRIKQIIKIYNSTYHIEIKCTPKEALEGDKYEPIIENYKDGKYQRRFRAKTRKGIKIGVGDVVLITKLDNEPAKNRRGRFLDKGKVIEKCGKCSFIVKKEDGRIVKRNQRDLKKIE